MKLNDTDAFTRSVKDDLLKATIEKCEALSADNARMRKRVAVLEDIIRDHVDPDECSELARDVIANIHLRELSKG